MDAPFLSLFINRFKQEYLFLATISAKKQMDKECFNIHYPTTNIEYIKLSILYITNVLINPISAPKLNKYLFKKAYTQFSYYMEHIIKYYTVIISCLFPCTNLIKSRK